MVITVITLIPSPYQVELFNAVNEKGNIDIQVVYIKSKTKNRSWQLPELRHPYSFVSDSSQNSEGKVHSSDLVVFSHYRDHSVRNWMRTRHASRQPWVFWGERPGFRYSGLVGCWARRVMLWPLYWSSVPIWGIGSWAVEKYEREFGSCRPYRSVPYYSNLRRFAEASRSRASGTDRVRLLYSGSLSRRKGVDLLAQAFARVAANTPRLHLDVLGEGPLREKMASHLEPVSDQVTFHGFVKWKNLPEYYASADVLIAPSRYDGWGLVVPEGLAAGMPVIGTRRMGAAIDLIRPGETGWRLPAGDLGALVEVLQGIDRSNQRELHRMGRQAQEDVMSTHTLSDGATAFCEYAKSAVEQQSA